MLPTWPGDELLGCWLLDSFVPNRFATRALKRGSVLVWNVFPPMLPPKKVPLTQEKSNDSPAKKKASYPL